MPESLSLTPQDALLATMIACSAADQNMRTAELVAIQALLNHLPIFAGYDGDRVSRVTKTVFELFEDEDGLDALFGLIRDALPERLTNTAYALACDVVTADRHHSQVELRMLEEMREALQIDPLHAAAIEWSARVRHMIP